MRKIEKAVRQADMDALLEEVFADYRTNLTQQIADYFGKRGYFGAVMTTFDRETMSFHVRPVYDFYITPPERET